MEEEDIQIEMTEIVTEYMERNIKYKDQQKKLMADWEHCMEFFKAHLSVFLGYVNPEDIELDGRSVNIYNVHLTESLQEKLKKICTSYTHTSRLGEGEWLSFKLDIPDNEEWCDM